jgi:hypothetical protein
MGLPFGTPGEPVRHFESRRGHAIRTLAAEGDADYAFDTGDTAADVVEAVRETWQPDLLVCWCPEVVPPPRAIEDCPIRTVAIVSDWTVYGPALARNLPRFDVVLTDRLGAKSLHWPGVTPLYWGPLYAQRTGVHRPLALPRDIDIAFAGNLNHAVHARRGRVLEKVAALSDRRQVVIVSGLPPEDYTALFNRARIVFNHALRHEMNLRCFEALACGALLFIEEENIEVRDCLRDREEVVFYREDNLVELLEHYLDDPEACARVAANGLARSADLAGEKRLDDLFDFLAAQPVGPRAFRDFPERDQALAEVLLYASSDAAEQRAYSAYRAQTGMEQYGDDPAFQVACACVALEVFDQAAHEWLPGERQRRSSEVMERFASAPKSNQDAATLWLNLATLCSRTASGREAEKRILELALQATSLAQDELLIGSRWDPYYARYRAAWSLGTARIDMLWAAAEARLAELLIEDGDFADAERHARKSIGWWPEIPAPYRTLSQALKALDRFDEAADALMQCLPLTAFDSEVRIELIELLACLGRRHEARALADESRRIFQCWIGAGHAAEKFCEYLRNDPHHQ